MSKRLEVEIEDAVYDYTDEIGEEDYGFVFDAEGNLKFAFVPEILPINRPKQFKK